MQTEAKGNATFTANDIEEPALLAFNTSNAILMALEGFGKHAMEEGHEIRALTELALAARNANADILKACNLYDQ